MRPCYPTLLFTALIIAAVVVTLPTSTSYSNTLGEVLDNATTCGDSGGCHGPPSENVTVYLEGPAELEVGEQGWYNATIVGGPSQLYGYYIVVTNSNNIAKTITGEPLVPVTTDQALNVTHDAPTLSNSLAFNLTAPKYGGKFIITVAYNSADGDGLNSSADLWEAATFEVQVVYPHEVVHWRTFYLGVAALLFVVSTSLYFRHVKLKLVV